ncbi:putative enterotoxin [Ophiocordyceps unilateralis]|uniref:Enterotoxin n=1 Tax=Ophiocordyceps unilateralis TaxID=268505 RepID=A0A2A9PIV2_OPHUN|nr:putative enterotoxin [Ophiocordyceps unilateralis]
MHTVSLILSTLWMLSWHGIGLAADTGCGATPSFQWPLISKPARAPMFVFRGDGRKPAAIRAEGGWLPWAVAKRTSKAFGLFNHEKDIKFAKGQRDTVYVSTTTSFDVAARYARMNAKGRKDTYVYYIRASPNMIDMNRSLGNETQFWWQREFSAMGGIRWSQVVGWVHANSSFFNGCDYAVPDCGSEDLNNNFFYQSLNKKCSRALYTPNPDYCEARWAPFTAGGWEPQLAGFAEYKDDFIRKNKPLWYRQVEPWKSAQKKSTETHAYEFMDKTKRATGWRGEFPLFRKEDAEAACPTSARRTGY